MRAFIYTGGSIYAENITEHPKGDDLIIAADSGYMNAKALGVTPDLLLGDLDSLGDIKPPKTAEILQVPAEKDFTDTQLAVDTAIKKGASEIIIVGGLSGRLDHTLANIQLAASMGVNSIPAMFFYRNGKLEKELLDSGSTPL